MRILREFFWSIIFVLVATALAIALLLFPNTSIEAQRILVTDGDLHRVSSVASAYRLTHSSDIKLLFDERGNDLLVGKSLEGGLPGSEEVDGTRLYLVKNDDGKTKPLTEKLVSEAFFDRANPRAYFSTVEQELYSVDLVDGIPRLLTRKVSEPSLSPDGRFMAYVKHDQNRHHTELGTLVGLGVFDIQTGKENQVTDSTDDFDPSWTPDGSHIMFMSAAKVQDLISAPNTINTQEVQQNTAQELPAGPMPKVHPGTAKDAKQITNSMTVPIKPVDASLADKVGSFAPSFFIMKPDGTEKIQLIDVGDAAYKDKVIMPTSAFSWARDGRSFVYDSDGTIWIGIFTHDFKKLSLKQIGSGRDPRWLEDNLITVIPLDARLDRGVRKITREGETLN